MRDADSPTSAKRWGWGTRPRDGRELGAYAAMILAVLAWWPLAGPLGKWQATIGMAAMVVVCWPVYAGWCRRRCP